MTKKTRQVVAIFEVPFLESWDKLGTDPVKYHLIPAIEEEIRKWHGTAIGFWSEDKLDNSE